MKPEGGEEVPEGEAVLEGRFMIGQMPISAWGETEAKEAKVEMDQRSAFIAKRKPRCIFLMWSSIIGEEQVVKAARVGTEEHWMMAVEQPPCGRFYCDSIARMEEMVRKVSWVQMAVSQQLIFCSWTR